MKDALGKPFGHTYFEGPVRPSNRWEITVRCVTTHAHAPTIRDDMF